jgi:hypothetical protein
MDIDVKNDALDFARPESETIDIVRKSLLQNDVLASFLVSPRRPSKFELHQLCLNLYAWIRCHVRRQVTSDVQCPVCAETIQSLLENKDDTKMTTKVVQWKIDLDRRDGQPLGVDVDSDSLEVVEVLEEGLIPQWNEEHADRAVKAGDRFRLVNGIIETESVIEECKAERLLQISVVREVIVRSDQDYDDLMKSLHGNGSSLLQDLAGAELRHRQCHDCQTIICGRCASMLALECNGQADALCPNCNRLMSGNSTNSSWLFWLGWLNF